MDRTKKYFIGIVVVAIIAIVLGIMLGRGPLGGQLDDVPLLEVHGNLERAQLFCNGGECKWLWRVKVESAKPVFGASPSDFVKSVPAQGDVIAVNLTDSRTNLSVELRPTDTYRADGSPVSVAEHGIENATVILIVAEIIGSGGLPEYEATPH